MNGEMVIQFSAAAQIRLILASNIASQVQQLTRDLQRSKYAYAFSHHPERKRFLTAMRNLLNREDDCLPTVVVLDYGFAAQDCALILRLIREAASKRAIACVITHPPADPGTRRILTGLGARLFDGTEEFALSELAFH